MGWEDVLKDLAARQESYVAKFQLPGVGLTSDHWWQARRNDRWDVVSENLIRLRGAPRATELARALGATLDAGPGAALHPPSTFALFGFRGYTLADLHVVRERHVRGIASTLAELHYLRDLRDCDVMTFRGALTLTPLRAIWVAAAGYAAPPLFELGYKKIGGLIDEAQRLEVLHRAALHRSVEELGERGRAGTVLMRALAEKRPVGEIPNDSKTEDRFEELLSQAGSRSLRRQVESGGEDVIGRVDFRDPTMPLVVEVNSVKFHTLPSDQANDEMRYEELNQAGFMVGVVWDIDIWSHQRNVAPTVAEARRRCLNGERGVIHSPSCPWPGARLALPPGVLRAG